MFGEYHKIFNYKETVKAPLFDYLLMGIHRCFLKPSTINKHIYSKIRKVSHCLPEIPSRETGKELKIKNIFLCEEKLFFTL
jgi:hypothetical protein